tara:strand:- start:4778 stop:4963 length:186 start_codon:yes stop_codon:yes gene_type:complete
MFIAGIYVDNQLVPKPIYQKASSLQLQKKTPSLARGRWILRQMTEKTEGVPANGSGIRSPP